MEDKAYDFLYTGQDRRSIPRTVRHLKIDPSVKEIPENAFRDLEDLIHVAFSEGLEVIGEAEPAMKT